MTKLKRIAAYIAIIAFSSVALAEQVSGERWLFSNNKQQTTKQVVEQTVPEPLYRVGQTLSF